jgi:hypothetical protein
LPIGDASQFEAGYKGNFNDITKDFSFPGTNIGTQVTKHFRIQREN